MQMAKDIPKTAWLLAIVWLIVSIVIFHTGALLKLIKLVSRMM